MVRHAHAKEDKEARRDDILRAALLLFRNDPRRLPAVASIADRAELAKGTVYLYFQTKEQIFTALLAREWDAVFADVEASFAGESAPTDVIVTRFIDRFVAFLSAHAYFVRLDSLAYAHLEENLPPDEYWRFKQIFSAALDRTGETVDTTLNLPPGRGLTLLVRSHAVVRGLWQTLDVPEHWRADERFQCRPMAKLDVYSEIQVTLQDLWNGALRQSTTENAAS